MGLVGSSVKSIAQLPEHPVIIGVNMPRVQDSVNSSSLTNSYVDSIPSQDSRGSRIAPEVGHSNLHRPSFKIGPAGDGALLNTRAEEENTTHASESLKVILSNDGSRRALMRFLRKYGWDDYLNFYFEVEEIKAMDESNAELLKQKAVELRSVHVARRVKYAKNAAVSQCWHRVNDALRLSHGKDSPKDIKERLQAAQTFVISLLSVNLDSFVNSRYYRDWESQQNRVERANNKFVFSAISGVEAVPKSVMVFSNPPGIIDDPARSAGPTPTSPSDTFPALYPKVLVVDDSGLAAKLVARALERNGHIVRICSHGRAALEVLRDEYFDLVLIDLYMPIMDGFSAVREFRRSISDGSSPSARVGVTGQSGMGLGSSSSASVLTTKLTTEEHAEDSGGDDDETRANCRRPEEVDNAIGRRHRIYSRNSAATIIGMSADNDTRTTFKAEKVGADGFLQKPFTLEKLSELLSQRRSLLAQP